MTSSTRTRSPRAALGGLAATALLSMLLVGCSASDDSASDSAGMADRGAAAPAAVSGDDEQTSADGEAPEGDSGSTSDQRQVIQTGEVSMRTKDALAAATAVVTHVEGVGGRVDDRSEQAGSQGSGASASLVVRVPAAKVTSTVDALRKLGTVDSVDLTAKDVTGAAEDLDARIHSLELSIDRMDALLAKATTSKDIIEAESALTERQANLEQLQSQRARLADQVALSTLTIHIYGPDVPAPVIEDDDPESFLDGLGVGWDAFVSAAKSVVIVLGVLLPWLAFVGAVVAGWAAVRRSRRRSSRDVAAPSAPEHPVAPAPEGPNV